MSHNIMCLEAILWDMNQHFSTTEKKRRIERLKEKTSLTTTEVGHIIFLSCSGVTLYCEQGLIKFSRVGNKRRKILPEDVKEYMAVNGVRNPAYVSDEELDAIRAQKGLPPLNPVKRTYITKS